MAETVIFFLSVFALVTTTQGQSCSKPVGKPNMSLKEEYILNNTFPDQARVSFACNSGYEPSGGSPTITCNAGSWSELTLTCERKSCGALGDVENGNVEYPDGIQFGDKAVITCNPGYALVGDKEILCMAQGWGGRLPTCDAVQCVTPQDVEKATFSPVKESYKYGEVVTYKCSSGLTAIGSLQLTCSDGGKFDVPPPTCVFVQCEDPITGLLDYEDGARPPYGFKSTIKVKCAKGYELVGHHTLQCTAESKWSPGIPTCKKAIVPPVTTTTTTATRSTTTHSPSVSPDPSDPRGGGNSVGIGLGIFAAVVGVAALVTSIILYKKRSAQRSTDRETAKDGENVRLS
uniref:Regulator of complement activation group 2 gene 1 n=1 Tax=Oryzias latipes TaxID=8090 RepID=A0A3B3I940_ORYLA